MQHNEAVRSARQAEALAALSVGQLASAAAFFKADEQVSRHEFQVIAHSLLGTGALSATAFVQAVPEAVRRRFERGHGFPIVERTRLGTLTREGHERTYFPLTFAATESKLPVKVPLGYDLGSDSIRATVLLDARDGGRPTATPVIHLPLGGTGINVFRPVYRDGAPTATVAERRAALLGFAIGGFQVSDLAAAATTALPDEVDAAATRTQPDRGRRFAGAR